MFYLPFKDPYGKKDLGQKMKTETHSYYCNSLFFCLPPGAENHSIQCWCWVVFVGNVSIYFHFREVVRVNAFSYRCHHIKDIHTYIVHLLHYKAEVKKKKIVQLY